jgi:hypothetical protein
MSPKDRELRSYSSSYAGAIRGLGHAFFEDFRLELSGVRVGAAGSAWGGPDAWRGGWAVVDRHGLEDLRRRDAIEKDERTMASLRKRPHWWDWELELSEHAEDRMEERGTDQLAIRWMLHHCSRWRRIVVVTMYTAGVR